MNIREQASAFAGRMVGLGFTVYLAKSGTYGFITDATQSRVLSFSMNDGSSLSGNYGPPSVEIGTGWRLGVSPYQLRTAEDVRQALYSAPFPGCGRGWKYYTNVAQHLAQYGASSGFVKVEA
mgnify:CR=1 FL=1|tara:strand:+ start:1313 stop:1678 length:366 start_codon:yes stop_codon:yes gene_type:complete